MGLGDRHSSLGYGQPVCITNRQAWAPASHTSPKVESSVHSGKSHINASCSASLTSLKSVSELCSKSHAWPCKSGELSSVRL